MTTHTLSRSDRPPRTAVVVAFGVLIAFGCALRFWKLGGVGLWYDELWTVVGASNRSFSDMYREWILGDSHPPGFFVFYFVWLKLVPPTEFWTRVPSAVAGVATIAYVLWGTTRLLSRQERLIAATLVSLSYVCVLYALSVKQYSALLLLTTIATVQYLEVVTSGRVERRHAITLGVAVVALAYLNYFGLVYAALLLVLALVTLWHDPAARRTMTRVVLACMLLSAPVAPFLYLQVRYNIDGWQPYQVATFVANLEPYLFFSDTSFVTASLGLLGVALVGRVALDAETRHRLCTRRNGHVAIVIAAFTAFMLILGIFKPIFYVRYFLAVVPAALLGLGVLTAAALPIERTWGALALLVFFVHAADTQFRSVDALQREQWDKSVDLVLRSRRATDLVYVLGANANKTEFEYLRDGDVDGVFNVRNLSFYRYYFERRGAPSVAAGLRVALPTADSARDLARRFRASGATIYVLAGHHLQYPADALATLNRMTRRLDVISLNGTTVYKLTF